jgi:GDPmannose 4,6-dehydratase
MKIYTGILFNNESPRRGIEFLSRKVCVGIAEIVRGKRDKITLGNLDAKRDWGYSKEYMEWVHKIMQHTHPDEFILATNETHSVKEFVTEAFAYAGISNWEDYVDFDKNLLRAAEVNILQGDYTRANVILGYEPKVRFKELVHIMMEAELNK